MKGLNTVLISCPCQQGIRILPLCCCGTIFTFQISESWWYVCTCRKYQRLPACLHSG